MKLIKVAAGVLNQTPLDWNGNLQNILQAISEAREQGVTVLCLPELCICGYGCEDAFHSRGLQKTAVEMLHRIAAETRGMIVSVGLPLMYAGGLFNTACLLADGRILGFVAKQHLAGDGIHYEPRWFKRWPEGVHAEVEVGGTSYPIGDLLYDCGGVKFGFEVCEDAWVGTRPGSSLAARGCDIILNPSASHFAFGKHAVRKRFVLEGSRAFQVSYVYANLVGNEAGRAIYDGDAMIASDGKMLAIGKRFSFRDSMLTTATVDVHATRMTRSQTGSFEPDVDGDESDVIPVPFTFPDGQLSPEAVREVDWETSDFVKEEAFCRAVSLGLFDYIRKSHSRGVVVSLSGGADSAAVTVLAASSLRMAAKELGLEKTVARILPDDAPSKAFKDVDELVRQLVTTVYQATRNSTATTREAAATVAQSLGTTHLEFDVDPLVTGYTEMVSNGVGRELNWTDDDIALQNIQARVRSPSVWMLANINRALLLATSNRSEAAVGYATMDGDTSGGLSPIAGIDKAFLRKWLRWMESRGPTDMDSIPGLRAVNVQQPTAELRPHDRNQTDEEDLMPYEVLDVIERLAVRDKLTPIEVCEHLKATFQQHSFSQLARWTIRFFRLFCRNQWKRERYAPSFHLDDENLDPKTWCRFPILSGGYEYEIAQLEEKVRQLQTTSKTKAEKSS